tara:strand:- start:69 stop:1346 length:1278 start_codon:yes stop_codon:yes gene_type:complete
MRFLWFFMVFYGFLFSQNNDVFVDGVAAIIEDNIVLKSDLNQMLNMMSIQQKINPNKDFNKYLKLKELVLGSMVDQKILLELAEKDTTIEVSEKEVNQALDQQVDNILLQAGGKKEAEKMLGQSIKSFRSEFWFDMKEKIVSEKYQQKALSKIKVSKKDITTFFDIYRDSLPLFPTEAKIRHLLIKPEPNEFIKKEIFNKLKTIKKRIISGEKFELLAKEFSMDPGSQKKGGELGWVKRGSLLKNFEEKTFTIKTNTISDPIETEVGFHILEVFERKGDRARVRHILIIPQINKEDKKRAFNFATTLKDSCLNIDLFKKYVKKYSKDYQTSDIGGNLGWIVPNNYPIKEIGQAIRLINENECSPPINSSFGFHLLWVEKVKKGGKPNLIDHWPKIEMMALNNKKMVWYEKWIKEKKDDFFIKIYN